MENGNAPVLKTFECLPDAQDILDSGTFHTFALGMLATSLCKCSWIWKLSGPENIGGVMLSLYQEWSSPQTLGPLGPRVWGDSRTSRSLPVRQARMMGLEGESQVGSWLLISLSCFYELSLRLLGCLILSCKQRLLLVLSVVKRGSRARQGQNLKYWS